MRFRTKLVLAWGILVLLVYISSLWPVHNTISTSFRQVAQNAFSGTKQSLHGMQAEQVARMRQAGSLLMNIPELRALIAEAGSELTAENTASLQERLDSLSRVVAVQSIFVMDAKATLIAQSERSPWQSLPRLQQYLAQSPQAHALVSHLFAAAPADNSPAPAQAREGIWLVNDQLYQAVGVPLTFSNDSADNTPAEVEGALIMVTPLTDDLAFELARRHNCSVSFVVGSHVIASSLTPAQRLELSAALARQSPATNADFQMQLGPTLYHSSFEPLVDAGSLATVGQTLVQSSLTQASAVQSALWENLAVIGLLGFLLAGVASFLLSTAVTRPVRSLLEAVRLVAGGKLDVSIRSGAGGEFRELADAFNHMVIQLRSRRELERQVETSRAASQAKSQFLANMSHEIRTPLNGVLGMIDLLHETKLDPKQKRFASLIKTSAKILSAVINDVLDFSKIEAGKIDLEALAFDLPLAVSEVIEILQPKAAAKNLDLLSSISPDLPRYVKGDPKRLQQILINLVNNALKFTEKGRVSISARIDSANPAAPLIRFEVTDTGIGIPPDRIHRLFQSFSQVDASTTRKYGGTGLGLAICKQLAELMGGAIGLASEPGQGSTFWFTIKLEPATQPPTAQIANTSAAQPAPSPHAQARARFKILLAEDNEINQIVTSEALCAAGYTCDIAPDGRRALAAAVTGKYDLILMDCQMPVLDGLAATQAIRRHERDGNLKRPSAKRLPIIALTASALSDDRELCLAAGMDAHCVKPLDKVELLRAMDSLLLENLPPASPTEIAPPTAAPPTAIIPPPAPPASDDTPIRLPALLARCMGRSALAAQVLQKFDTQAAASIGQLTAHLNAGEAEPFARISHTLKGTASLMSADAVARIAGELEHAANARDFNLMQQQLASLTDEIHRCAEFISKTHIASAQDAPSPTPAPSPA